MSLAGIIKAWQAIIDRNLFHFGSSDSSSLKNKIGIWQNHKIVEEQNPDKKTSLMRGRHLIWYHCTWACTIIECAFLNFPCILYSLYILCEYESRLTKTPGKACGFGGGASKNRPPNSEEKQKSPSSHENWTTKLIYFKRSLDTLCFLPPILSSWWFQPIWQIFVKLVHFPK